MKISLGVSIFKNGYNWDLITENIYSYAPAQSLQMFQFFDMETRFHSCVTILLLLEHTFGQSQLHGHFSFVGFVNFSPNQKSTKSIIGDQTIAKSQLKCSSNCFANDDCYFFDFCKTGSS